MFIIYFFSGFVKKNNKRWGFGSRAGKEFRGNAKYLYNYVRSYHKEIEIRKKEKELIKNKYYEVVILGILKKDWKKINKHI